MTEAAIRTRPSRHAAPVTSPHRPRSADVAELEELADPSEPWVPRKTNDELERDDLVRDGGPLKDYFESMRERGLLD